VQIVLTQVLLIRVVETYFITKISNITKLHEFGQVLYEQSGLVYSADQNLTDIKLLLAPPSGRISHEVHAPFEDHIVVNTTKLVWLL